MDQTFVVTIPHSFVAAPVDQPAQQAPSTRYVRFQDRHHIITPPPQATAVVQQPPLQLQQPVHLLPLPTPRAAMPLPLPVAHFPVMVLPGPAVSILSVPELTAAGWSFTLSLEYAFLTIPGCPNPVPVELDEHGRPWVTLIPAGCAYPRGTLTFPDANSAHLGNYAPDVGGAPNPYRFHLGTVARHCTVGPPGVDFLSGVGSVAPLQWRDVYGRVQTPLDTGVLAIALPGDSAVWPRWA